MKLFLTLLSLACLSAPSAFARDSIHYVCSGYEKSGRPDPDNYGFVIIYDEERGPVAQNGGEALPTRRQILSTVWAGALYQADVREKDFGRGTVSLVDPRHKNKVFFRGSFQLTEEDSGDATMQLRGKLSTRPGDCASKDAISTTLRCANISN